MLVEVGNYRAKIFANSIVLTHYFRQAHISTHNSQYSQYDQRQRHCPRAFVQVMLLIFRATERTIERKKIQTEHIEGSHHCCCQCQVIHYRIAGKSIGKDRIFREEARETRNTGNSETTYEEGDLRDAHALAEAAHLADVLLAAHSMDNTARTQEQQRLEECMRHNMEDGGSICTYAEGEEHKAKLANGRVCKHFFNVILTAGNSGCKQSCSKTYDSHNMKDHRGEAV